MIASPKTVKSAMRSALLVGALVVVTACTAQYRKHGWIPGPELLNEVVVGVDTRDSVSETIGEPTIDSLADDSGYYYVTSRIKRFGAKQPEVISRDLVAITFDGRGVVDSVQRYTLADGRVICCSHDWGPLDSIGNLDVDSLDEVWNGDSMNHYRALLWDRKANSSRVCADCSLAEGFWSWSNEHNGRQ